MISVTRKATFSASHRLHNPEWSEEKNIAIYDICNNPKGHGHNYILEVTVSGNTDPESGYVIDLKKMKRIINENIIQYVDHKHLNFDVPFLKGIIPTSENIAVVFWDILKDKFEDKKLTKIKLWETENNVIEYTGEPIEIKKFNNYIA